MGKGAGEDDKGKRPRQRQLNTAADIAEAGADDGDNEDVNSEDGESEHEDRITEDGEGAGGQRTQSQKRRQTRSFLLHNRKEDTILTAMCQVGGMPTTTKVSPCPTRHSGCTAALLQVSPSPQRED